MPKKKKPSLPQTQVYRVKSPFTARVGGVRRTYAAGPKVYRADDPVVVQCPHNFEPVLTSPPVETTTAAPGEMRNVRPPRPEPEPEPDIEPETEPAEPTDEKPV